MTAYCRGAGNDCGNDGVVGSRAGRRGLGHDRNDSARLRNVVGCGVIAQVMHLPHLAELRDRYEIAALCDISEPTARACAEMYGVEKVFTSWQESIGRRAPHDVVMVLTSRSHAPIGPWPRPMPVRTSSWKRAALSLPGRRRGALRGRTQGRRALHGRNDEALRPRLRAPPGVSAPGGPAPRGGHDARISLPALRPGLPRSPR